MSTKLIIGLGNPGEEYKNTRHNVGFDTIDLIADKLGINHGKKKCRSIIGEGFIGLQKVLLAKPQTYMNLSGIAVKEIMDWYKIDLSNIIIVYDDIDLDSGVLRVRSLGGAGTHNGLKNIVYQLESINFARIRVGIGAPPKCFDLANYVLSSYKNSSDSEKIIACIQKAAEACIFFIENGINLTMNRFNTAVNKDE